jgi:hypothetical protein
MCLILLLVECESTFDGEVNVVSGFDVKIFDHLIAGYFCIINYYYI